MSETRHTAHAAQGRPRLRQAFLERPDTVVHLPGGETLTLRRSEKEAAMPLFRKLDTKKFDLRSGHLKGKRGKNGKGSNSEAGGMTSMMPFSKLIITAFLVHQVYGIVKSALSGLLGRRRGDPGQAGRPQLQGTQAKGQAIQMWASEHDEEDLDEEGKLRLAAARKAQADMARAMVRNALPRPKHKGLPERMSQAHANRPRHAPSAKQRMAPSKDVKIRPKGKLEKLDAAVQKEIKEALAAVRKEQQLLQLQQGTEQLKALPMA